MATDPKELSIRQHRQWIGLLQPVGLVVSAPALADADCHVDTSIPNEYQAFLALTQLVMGLPDETEPVPVIRNLREFLQEILEWPEDHLVPGDDPRAASLSVPLPEYGETLQPSWAVPDLGPNPAWLMLIQELPIGTLLDQSQESNGRHWSASPQVRFERLLRESQVPVGLLSNGTHLRLVYSPRGESPGHMTFPVAVMREVAGRPIFVALRMLLRANRVFTAPDGKRLGDLLAASRKYQNTVSTELSGQVLAALYELLRGFQSADADTNGELLGQVLANDPDQVYAGQLTVLLRLVFLLYAEDRGLMSDSEIYVRHYSVIGLFEKLRSDMGRHQDTMDQRYGAWARLVTLFRLVHDGGSHGTFRIPPRHGYLFDPDRYPFLEGRAFRSERKPDDRLALPRVSDGVIFRVLNNLLILDGERLSYRALDVEQIGSVYESMMGFRVEVAKGRSIALKPKKPHGAPLTINLEELLQQAPAQRAKWLKETADTDVPAGMANAIKSATTPDAVVAALGKKVATAVTPNIVPVGSMVLQPSDERRRSGSHYTPRSLTGPIVRKALEPVLQAFGPSPNPDQILGLKICDPAVGSGAFLVESGRQLAELLVKAWAAYYRTPKLPPDEDELLHAQRLIAQRCLYGVDRNPMAVDLAKLALWLATLAKDHPFTFIDHALRCGDSLVGLTREQIADFRWTAEPSGEENFYQDVTDKVNQATRLRAELLAMGDDTPETLKAQKLALADEALQLARFTGNLVIAAFFAEDKPAKRDALRRKYLYDLSKYIESKNLALRPTDAEKALRTGEHPVTPFHWEIEFPEVFDRAEKGFDCIVGNPPFAGKNTIGAGNRPGYLDWLKELHVESHGNSDLVAHFFRRVFNQIKLGGTFGLIATNTIAQGDTRSTGLRWICTNGGTIYAAKRRYKWPGLASVVVSVIHVVKGQIHNNSALADAIAKLEQQKNQSQSLSQRNAIQMQITELLREAGCLAELNGKSVERITAYLFHAGGDDDPAHIQANKGKGFKGTEIGSLGYLLTQENQEYSDFRQLNDDRVLNRLLLRPYYTGEDLNSLAEGTARRFVVDVDGMSSLELNLVPQVADFLKRCVREDLLSRGEIEEKTEQWWDFRRPSVELRNLLKANRRYLGLSRVSNTGAFAFISGNVLANSDIICFSFDTFSAYAVLQSRTHDAWARFFASSMKDDLRYTPSDCFETFPFPENFETNPALETVGQAYYEFRAALMVRNNEGLTKTYNRFHDPAETSPDILKLRELHAEMDRAVLNTYGGELAALTVPPCQFLLDYEDDEDEEPTGRQRKKPWRYRWPDVFRDEVLALLLELNKQRAEAERAMAPKKPGKKAKGKKSPVKEKNEGGLFDSR